MVYIKEFLVFLRDIYKSKNLIIELTKQDIRSRYLGSLLGILWAFIQPTVTILIFWFVFQVGFKSMPVDNFPFILWLICGMIPWNFFSESLQGATNSIVSNSYLVKKVVFRVSSLPIIKIFSALFIHLFFICFIFLMFYFYDYKPTVYGFQVIYYLTCSIILVLGLSWITSSLNIFIKDIGQIVAMLLQFGFWLTPIFWSLNIMPEKYHLFIKLNPMFYIVEGYRNTFIYHKWFWEDLSLTMYFWSVCLIVLISGAFIFKKLKPHFADVL